MKNILILADGIVAKHFLHRISETFISTNCYTVVTFNKSVLPKNQHSFFKFYTFDPTSYIKLSKILKHDFDDVFIVMKNRVDAEESYRNIRRDKPFVRVTFLNKWGIVFNDENLLNIDASELLASRLYDFLPNVPVIAQNVGLGQGEIVEVLVPFGSSYVYRHIGTIIQNQWRIVGLYRSNKLILPTPSLMIKPNDVLLLVGKPSVLESVFKEIKQELGQFPAPFGENLYLYIDMQREDKESILNCLEQVTYLHKRIKGRQLIIRVNNPTEIKLIERIKSLDNENIETIIDYSYESEDKVIKSDIVKYNIGLIICSDNIFSKNLYKKIFFSIKRPVLKLSQTSLMHLNKLVVILSEEKNMEIISTTVFDVASQLDLDIELQDFKPDGKYEKKSFILSHYENLSDIFSKKLQVIQGQKNPIRELSTQKDFLQVIPFTKKIISSRIFSIFSTDFEKLYFKLSDNPQLFVPGEIE